MQTSWAAFFRRTPTLLTQELIVQLRDGAQLTTAVLPAKVAPQAICLFFHGITGSANSHYVQGMLKAIADSNLPVTTIAVNHRGSLGELCRTQDSPKFYHAGMVEDIQDVIAHTSELWPGVPIFACGVSLSGNMLVRGLGKGLLPELKASMVVSVPFDLKMSADAVDAGIGRLYRAYLLRRMRKLLAWKQAALPWYAQPERLKKLHSFWGFDGLVIGPLHGFRNAYHYYREASSRSWVKHIRQPLLVIQSLDDPLVPAKAWPAQSDIPACVNFEAYNRGGHVGFIDYQGYWLERRIVSWLAQALAMETNEGEHVAAYSNCG